MHGHERIEAASWAVGFLFMGLMVLPGTVARGEGTDEGSGQEGRLSAGPVERLEDGRLRVGGMTLDQESGTIDIPGRVNMRAGAIEVFACAPWGKTHESVVVLTEEPYLVQVGLLLLFGLPPGSVGLSEAPDNPDSFQPEGPVIGLTLIWEDSTGSKVEIPAEQCVCMAGSGEQMDAGNWSFTGSILDANGFAAQLSGTVVATWVDPIAIVNNSRPEAWDDEAYVICPDILPPVGTPLTLRMIRRSD